MSSALSSAALSSGGSSIADAGSSILDTGSSDAEGVGSSAEVFDTMGSSGISGILDTVQTVLQLRDTFDPLLSLF